MARNRTRRTRRRRSGGGTATMKRAKVAGYTALYAYMKEHGAPKQMAKMPTVPGIGYDATAMVIAHYGARHAPRTFRKPLDYLATGLAGKVGYDFGVNKFSISGLAGVGEDAILGGEIDPNDFDEEEFDEAVKEAMDD